MICYYGYITEPSTGAPGGFIEPYTIEIQTGPKWHWLPPRPMGPFVFQETGEKIEIVGESEEAAISGCVEEIKRRRWGTLFANQPFRYSLLRCYPQCISSSVHIAYP